VSWIQSELASREENLFGPIINILSYDTEELVKNDGFLGYPSGVRNG
jgi:hypothetical protein